MGYSTKSQFRSSYGISSFMAGDVVYTPGKFTELGRVTMTSLQSILVGTGSAQGQNSALGRMFAKFQDSTPTQIQGYIRLDVHDANDEPVATIIELRTEDVNTSQTDRRQMYPLPITGEKVPPSYSLVLKLNADAGSGNGTATLANCSLLLNIVKQTLVND